MITDKTIRITRSICPTCFKELKAELIYKNQKIFFEKICPEHGDCSIQLSSYPEYFLDLSKAFFTIMPKNLPRRMLGITLTPKCDLNCPICSVMPSVGEVSEPMTVEDVDKIISDNPDKEFILWGMEPTENKDIGKIINLMRKKSKIPYLFTNGLKLADFNLLAKLKESGLSHVYLQFDGFSEYIYSVLRADPLLYNNKLRALENLRKLEIETCLNVTLAKGVNEDQINSIINYAIKNDFIKQIGFLPLIKVGNADGYRKDILPELHEFLAIIEKETTGRITMDNLRIFQKFMYIFYRFAKFRRCFWFTVYILIRDKKNNSYRTLDELVDFKKIDRAVNEYINDLRNSKIVFISSLRVILKLLIICLNFKTFILACNCLKFIIKGKKLHMARSNKSILFITCVDFCDFYKVDLDMSDVYCEEILAIKNKSKDIICKPSYRMLIDELRERLIGRHPKY